MICPNCNKEMKAYFSPVLAYTDDDYDENISGYQCRKCKIEYNDVLSEWILPTNLMPTDKQVKAERFILNRLKINPQEYPITKRQYCEFIGKYLPKAQEVVDNYEIEDDYYYDYYEEEF